MPATDSVASCMKRTVYFVQETDRLGVAAQILSRRHIGLLPVVDSSMHVLGIMGLRDLLEICLPDFFQLLDRLDFVKDFGAVEETRPSPQELQQPVRDWMRPAITVRHDSGLLRAYALMIKDNLHDLPVIDEQGRLVGIASRVDIGVAIVSKWGLGP